jgi:hypothetical protein
MPFALAQDLNPFAIDLKGWMGNMALFAAGLATLVNLVREPLNSWLAKNHWNYQIDGRWRVFVFGALVGGGIGAVGDLMGLLTVPPFSTYTKPFGGVFYGIVVAAMSFLGVNFVDLLASRSAKAQSKQRAAEMLPFLETKAITDGVLLLLGFFFPGVAVAKLAPFLPALEKILGQSLSPEKRNAQILAWVSHVKKTLGLPEKIIEV